jgi:hypothetical protein
MVHSTLPRVTRWSGAAALALAVACGADETQPTNADHTPEFYTISVNGNLVSPPYTLQQGQTVLVRINFLNKESQNLDDVESSHFAGLTFQPSTLASAVRRADHHFQFDVTGETEGSGTMTVGFGHDDAADETTFPAAAVTVVGETPGAQ